MKKFISCLLAVSMVLCALPFVSVSAANVPTLTVDMTNRTGPMRHGSGGFLYGLGSHGSPDVNTLTPLKPGTAVQKAPDGLQHPTGDVLDVAETFIEAGGEQVQIYLQDIFALWSYEYTTIEDYLKRIEEMVPKIKALRESRTDFTGKFVYVPYNEPDGIWFNNINSNTSVQNTFNDYWKRAYDLIRSLDPDALIGGVSFATYQSNAMESWIRFCTQNNCEPDYITWHELQTDKLSSFKSHLDHYRGLEKKYGMAEREIIINEYAPQDHCSVPGKLVNWIALFEENKVSGCLPYWHNAGNLNDIAADNNEPNGAWWLYKWYGDMSGETLKLTTSTARDQLYGLASIDDNKKSANVIFGGIDGHGAVVLNNIADTEAFKGAAAVDIKVEATYWTAFHGVAAEPTVIRTGTLAVKNGSVTVELDDMEATAAYNITVTAATDPDNAGTVFRGPWRKTWEAEDAALSGGAKTTDYRWTYARSGGLRVTGIVNSSDSVGFSVSVPQSGYYRADLVYGNGYGLNTLDPPNNATATVAQERSVDGKSDVIYLENTLRAEMSGMYTEYIYLEKGEHEITYRGNGKTSLGADLDCLTLTYSGAEIPVFDSVYEAELGDFNTLLDNGETTVTTENEIPGYSASGYITGLSGVSVENGGGVRFTVVVPDNGLYNLTLRAGAEAAATANIYLDNTALTLTNKLTSIEIPAAEGFADSSVTVFLQKGINIIDIDAESEIALDYMRVSLAGGVEDKTVTVQAEDGKLLGKAEAKTNAYADGKSYVANIEGATDDALEITVNVPEAGEYQMVIRHSSGELFGAHDYNAQIVDRYASFTVNAADETRLYFKNSYSTDNWRTVAVPVSLQAGENTVRFFNDNWRIVRCGVLKPGTSQHIPENIDYQTLVNYAPNFDSFSFTPAVLSDAAETEELYKITVMATEGGLVTASKNSAAPGETVTLTFDHEYADGKVRVTANGVDVSDQVIDGILTYTVTGNTEFRVIFVTPENDDKLIVNNSFGTGDLSGWTVEGEASVLKRANETYYAVLSDEAAISQTVKLEKGYYFLDFEAEGQFIISVTDADGEVQIFATDESSGDVSIKIPGDEATTIAIKAVGELTLDSFRLTGFEAIDPELLYFVDCGDSGVDTLTGDDKFGTLNSVSDQFFAADPITGAMWGIDDVYKPNANYPNLLTGELTWPYEYDTADDRDKVVSYRYAKDQNDRTGPGVTYKFELPDGDYTFELAFYQPSGWASANRRASLRVNNVVIASAITPTTDPANPKIVRARASVSGGLATLNLKLDSNGSGGPMISYIKISQAKGKKLDTTGMKTTDAGTWENNNHAQNAFDGDVNSFFDGNKDSYAQIDLGREVTLSGISYVPRLDWAGRMVNSKFYGSKDGSNWTVLYTVTKEPPYRTETYVSAEDFATEDHTWRYIRYRNSNDYCNVSEIYLFEEEPEEELPGESLTDEFTLLTLDGGKITYESSVDALLIGASYDGNLLLNAEIIELPAGGSAAELKKDFDKMFIFKKGTLEPLVKF